MKCILQYEAEGYEGVDASLSTSLFEYGLIWVKGKEGHEKDYHFIYGVGMDMKTGEYNSFDWGNVSIDTDLRKEWDFVDWEELLKFVGYKGEEERYFQKDMLPQIVYDLISYYGHGNIFGSSYYPFEILSEDEVEECGQCGDYHPVGYAGDCRDDRYRF